MNAQPTCQFLRARLVEFAVSVMDLCDELPKTAAAPNYAEARGAESSRDFLHKLGLALKGMNESEVWLDMILRRRMADEEQTRQIRQECNELCRILAASTPGSLSPVECST